MEHDIERIPQPPYCPDMNFCGRFTLHSLDDARELIKNFLATLNHPTLTRQLQCFREDLQKTIDNEGDYLKSV